MKIHLNHIHYKTKPLIWTYDPGTDEAICDMSVLNPELSETYFPEDIMNDLVDKNYPFITIQNGEASISRLSDFLVDYPMHPIPFMNKNLSHAEEGGSPRVSPKSSPQSSPKRITRSASKLSNIMNALQARSHSSHRLRKTSSSEAEHETIEPIHEEVKTVRTSATLRAISEIEEQNHLERFDYRSIEPEKLVLFNEDQTLWRNTFAMLGDFNDKLVKETESSSDAFLTSKLLAKQLILSVNPDIYAARGEVVKQLGHMLTALNTVFIEISDKISIYHREALYCYFQEALEEAMSVSPVISGKTEFEALNKEECTSVFKGNYFWQQATNKKALELRYKLKTAKWACLLKENQSIQLGGKLPEPYEIEQMLLTFLDTSAFEKALSKQPAISVEQRTTCSLIMNFNNKIRAFCQHQHQYRKQLKSLFSESPPTELDFEDYFAPEIIDQVRKGLTVAKKALRYQALSVFKKELDSMEEMRSKLAPQLKEINAAIFDVTEMEVKKRLLGHKINRMLSTDRPLIVKYHSLKHLIVNILNKTLRRKNKAEDYKTNMLIAENATEMIILTLSLCPPNVLINDAIKERLNKREREMASWVEEILGDSKPDELTQQPVKIPTVNPSEDKNIYLSPDWVKKLSQLISNMDELEIMKKHPGKKNADIFCKKLVLIMVRFYLTEFDIVTLPEHRLARS